jgi:acyl-coenzyme A synthetase/AMP-(fatty) acid ligase
MAIEPGLTQKDVIFAVSSISFDASVLELYLPLLVGARVVVSPRDVAMDGERLAEQLAKTHATVLHATPATFRLMLAAGWQGQPGLRVLSGGDLLTRDLANALLPRCAELWNMYGPTETTVLSTVHRVQPGEGPISIGHAIANADLHVLEGENTDALKHVALGEAGELYIGGAGVARGYLNRPDLTAERFIPDPFSNRPAARLYKTGDLVRLQADGSLQFIGRIDHQVKIRGFRIELGEVEANMLSHPDVHAAAAVAQPDSSGELQLVGYFVPEAESITNYVSEKLSPSVVASDQAVNLIAQLRQYLKSKFPLYMIPTRFVAVNALPLNPSGKVDRNALPKLETLSDPYTPSAYAGQRTSTERQLTEIWQDILKIGKIGIHDNFFDIGGHSLLVAQLFRQIKCSFDCTLPLAAIFDSPTIGRLEKPMAWSGLV